MIVYGMNAECAVSDRLRQKVLLIAEAVFGKCGGINGKLGQKRTEPHRTDTGELDLHQDLTGLQKRRAVIAQTKIQFICAPADIAVKGQTKLRVFRPGEGHAVIGQKKPRLRLIKTLEPEDLLRDLPGLRFGARPARNGAVMHASMLTRRL